MASDEHFVKPRSVSAHYGEIFWKILLTAKPTPCSMRGHLTSSIQEFFSELQTSAKENHVAKGCTAATRRFSRKRYTGSTIVGRYCATKSLPNIISAKATARSDRLLNQIRAVNGLLCNAYFMFDPSERLGQTYLAENQTEYGDGRRGD